MTEDQASEVESRIDYFYNNPKAAYNFSAAQMWILQKGLFVHTNTRMSCHNKSVELPSNYKNTLDYMPWICHSKVSDNYHTITYVLLFFYCYSTILKMDGTVLKMNFQGTGTKEIVLVGNSLSRDLFVSIEHFMKDTYSYLTVFTSGHCSPFMSNWTRVVSWCNQVIIPSLKSNYRRIFQFIIFFRNVLMNVTWEKWKE